MDLSGVIIVVLGILVFFGGAAWLEIRSRKNNRPAGQRERPPLPAVSTMPVRHSVSKRRTKSD